MEKVKSVIAWIIDLPMYVLAELMMFADQDEDRIVSEHKRIESLYGV